MIEPISNENLDKFTTLSQIYEAEFAPLTGAKKDNNGLYPLSTPINKTHAGYLLYHDNKAVGFIVINTEKEPFDVCEFFILKKYRRQKLGQELAFKIFDLHPGRWTVKQLYNAVDANTFWLKIINKYTKSHYTQTLYDDDKWGKVYMQSFSSK